MRTALTLVCLSIVFICGSAIAQNVTSTAGTTNNVPKYSGATSLGSSAIYEVNGSVGIGTSTPGAQLDIGGSGLMALGSQLYISATGAGANNYQRFSLGYGAHWDNVNGNYFISDTVSNQATFADENGTFVWTVHGGPLSSPQTYAQWHAFDRMAIAPSGNVGIGTTTPGATLEVNGNILLTQGNGASITFQDGTIQATAWNGVLSGGDYAESVNVSGDREVYEPGDVLVIDPASEGNFLRSSEPYSTTVTGIYSTKPGVVGRRQLTARAHMKEEVPMAMTGIVPTRVSAENGPIKPGDLLVTSSKAGYAMKGTDRAQMLGAIIGKAVGHLDSGLGVIEVVVTLQ